MGKGRQCSESCLEYILAEATRHYRDTPNGPPPAVAVEAVGFRVGRQLAERYTRDRQRLAEQLELMKFICRDFWTEVFRKQVDGLRTNHKGTFVLKDNAFKWLLKLSAASAEDSHTTLDVAREQLVFPCALLRGALAQLGVEATVTADPSNLPVVDFTIFIKQRTSQDVSPPPAPYP